MKLLRRLHLYLGCFFAPLLLFYVLTGWYQTFNPNRNKGIGEGETWIARLRSIHVDQIYPAETAQSFSPAVFRVLVVFMAVAFVVTVVLGIVLAFRTVRPQWPVWAALALGVFIPVICLWLGLKR